MPHGRGGEGGENIPVVQRYVAGQPAAVRRLGEVDVVAGEMGGGEGPGEVEEPDRCAGRDVGDGWGRGEMRGDAWVDGEIEGGCP